MRNFILNGRIVKISKVGVKEGKFDLEKRNETKRNETLLNRFIRKKNQRKFPLPFVIDNILNNI